MLALWKWKKGRWSNGIAFYEFATGALQAVDKNIDRYRAEKAAEEERTDAAAQRMKELEFQRETTFEAQKEQQPLLMIFRN